MASILIAYSTVDGHTRKICERVQRILENTGHTATLASLSEPDPLQARLFDKVVIGASIRHGRYRRELYDYISANQRALEDRPSAFFSVNVVARKPAKSSPATSPYVKRFWRETTWRPPLVAVFAGEIDYRKYGFFDRQMIRFIMLLTNGPTGRNDCVDFTDWESVDVFARDVGREP